MHFFIVIIEPVPLVAEVQGSHTGVVMRRRRSLDFNGPELRLVIYVKAGRFITFEDGVSDTVGLVQVEERRTDERLAMAT